jgi:CHAT domain-containing protein/uncharacterized protein HemY
MKKLNKLLFIAAIALIFLLQQPVFSTNNNQTISEIEAKAEQLYQQNQYPKAINLLKTAIKQYQKQGDRIGGAIATRNLALIYQKLGKWEKAQTTLEQAATIIATIEDESKQSQLLAQVGEVKGQIELSLGKAQSALETWKQATNLYEKQGNITGLVQGKIYQASALQELGLYTQSIKTLTATKEQLQEQPDTLIKAQALLNLGDILNRISKYQSAQTILKSGLAIAEKLAEKLIMAEIYLNLGNNARLQNQTLVALDYYQQAIKIAPQPDLQLRGKLEQLQVLVSLSDQKTASNLVAEIQQLLSQLPIQQTTIQAQISLARYLLDLNTPPGEIAELLAKAVKQAKNLNIIQTEAEAWGELGHLYELNQQWQTAAQLTEQALVIAQSVNAKELAYQWQWQMGRILKAQGQRKKAIAAYTQATANLQSLRSDLIAISSNVQYSFRTKIEPVYRQLATLLLEPDASQADLNQARQIIESLQIAELDNFFRDACLDTQTQQIEQLDPTAAVIYTIILGDNPSGTLRDHLEVVAAIPGQPLRHYSHHLPPDEIELVITSANSQLIEPRRLNLRLFQQAYDWLVRPLETELKTHKIKTLVFVPDGILRNLPPATLHDGQQYLIEKYSVAIAPSLQLAQLQGTVSERQDILLAGISESRQGFNSLPGVKQEIEQIQPLFASSVLLDSKFTEVNFNRSASQTPFRIVHLATHGQFSSNAEDTFILTWDDRINIEELNHLLRGDSKQMRPIELLVLSACQTAMGDRLATLGLAGIAVRAGARSTVASLWAVDDSATVALMTYFYQALAKGNMNKAEALRQAQISIMKNETFSHPFYWSAFIFVGNWQ